MRIISNHLGTNKMYHDWCKIVEALCDAEYLTLSWDTLLSPSLDGTLEIYKIIRT